MPEKGARYCYHVDFLTFLPKSSIQLFIILGHIIKRAEWNYGINFEQLLLYVLLVGVTV